jgi:hypothetical protein
MIDFATFLQRSDQYRACAAASLAVGPQRVNSQRQLVIKVAMALG